ncbi:MAG: NADH-quinone oxidoreductase subunit NuoG [Actinomycetota bacterium]|nr:NADH-quinone oxidoreductase subunit NuoG [Actinomycetota bacterium]
MGEVTPPQATDLASVTINGQTVRSEKGRLLIDVAEEIGVFVPRFCYHPGMASVAVCRMCLVKVEGQNKLLPACATPVADGMTVDTVDEQAVDAQEGMLEFLLINHPLDCPTCDRAGECPLQDQTYAHGPGSSRYVEPKRSYEKALAISELVVLDRERCVLCWRCVRFSDEIAGDQFIQLVDRGAGTQILTFSDEPFDSYFSGNTVQICPVGALLSRPYRFVSRPWDLDTAPSVCSYCAVGCPISNEQRSDKIVRCQAMPNENVNDFWICDKGRYGYHHVNSDDRLETPLVRNAAGEFETTGWADAIERIVQGVKDKRAGVIAGAHLTTEDAYAIARLARKDLKTKDLDSRIQDDGAPYELALRLHGAAGSSAELRDLEAARSIVWIGPDPKETLPVLYLRLRKAVTQLHTKLTVVGPRRISLDDFATHSVRTDAGHEADALRMIANDAAVAHDLGGPMVVCWGPLSPGRDESGVFHAAIDLALAKDAQLLVCPPHAGSQGMIDMGVHPGLDTGYKIVKEPGRGTRAILEAAAGGELDALLVFGADLISDFPDGALARRALEKVPFSAVVELFPTETALLADVVLPATAYAEREGTLTNLERRVQKLEPLLAARGSAIEPWRICARIAGALGSDWKVRDFDDLWKEIKKASKPHKDLDLDDLTKPLEAPAPQAESPWSNDPSRGAVMVQGPGGRYPKGHRAGAPFHTGQNWPLSWELRAFEAKQRPGYVPEAAAKPGLKDVTAPGHVREMEPGGDFRLYTGRFIYDSGAMVSRTRALRSLARRVFVEMNDRDVKEMGLADGDEVVVSGNGAEIRAPLKIADIAEGAVFVPFDQPGARANVLVGGRDPRVTVRPA